MRFDFRFNSYEILANAYIDVFFTRTLAFQPTELTTLVPDMISYFPTDGGAVTSSPLHPLTTYL
jgi:hypothetical protein